MPAIPSITNAAGCHFTGPYSFVSSRFHDFTNMYFLRCYYCRIV